MSGHEDVGVEDRILALHHRGQPLEPRSGVDARRGKRAQRALRVPIVLHEHQVPDLHDRARIAQLDELVTARRVRPILAEVVVKLRARPARPHVGHLPEVVLVSEPEDAARRQPDLPLPELGRLVIRVVHRGEEAIRIESVHLRHELPREGDRLLLEVVAEREVAEHLEEGEVPGGSADLFQVVVLAARTHALLGGRRPRDVERRLPEEHALELHHARVREQKRGIVGRHERGARQDGVPLRTEVVQELAANLVGRHGSWEEARRSAWQIVRITGAMPLWSPRRRRDEGAANAASAAPALLRSSSGLSRPRPPRSCLPLREPARALRRPSPGPS